LVSDVTADRLDVIGSGPTIPIRKPLINARELLRKYRLESYETCHYSKQAAPSNFMLTINALILNNEWVLNAILNSAKMVGYHSQVIATQIANTVDSVARLYAQRIIKHSIQENRPNCFISGGETTLAVSGKGHGGRNQELALRLLLYLLKEYDSIPDFCFISLGSDGTDGPTDAAGALLTKQTLRNVLNQEVNPETYKDENDSYTFFQKVGGLLKTGHTGTNVMDVHILMFK